MPNVTIVTPWRQRAYLVPQYQAQIITLDYCAHCLRFVFVENDSTDGTHELLREWADTDPRISLYKRDTGQPLYPSIVNMHRFEIMGTVFNWALDAVDYNWTDYVLFMPCDIRYGPDLLRRLLAHHAPVVSPFVYQNGRFYDIWAFSRNGRDFAPFPEGETETLYGTELVEMSTMGGVALIDADVLRAGVRYSLTSVDRGFMEAARAKGYGVFADPTLHVYHG